MKNLLPGECKSGVQSVYKVSEHTQRELSAGCSLFILFPNLPPDRVHPDFTCSEPISRGLSAHGASCFYDFQTYLQGTVGGGGGGL